MMRKMIIAVICVIFGGCAIMTNLKAGEDSKYLKAKNKEGAEVILDTEEIGKPMDLRDFAFSGKYYFTLEGGSKKRLNLFDGLGNYLISVGSTPAESGEKEAFKFPSDMFYSVSNNVLYILDSMARKVHIFSPDGKFLNTLYDFSYDDEENPFYPSSFKYNQTSGFFIMIDTYNHRLLETDSGENVLMTIEGTTTQDGSFEYPQAVAVDESGNYYVGAGNKIKVFSPRGEYIFSFPLKYTKSISNISDMEFWFSKYLVVTDPAGGKVLFFSLTGDLLASWTSFGAAQPFIRPFRIFIDQGEKLYIIDNGTQQVIGF